jgi:choline dehydrogenase
VHRFAVRIGTLYPRSRGWVKLRSADPAAPPRIFFNMFGARADLDDMVRAIRMTRELYRTEPQKSLIAHEMFPGDGVADDAAIERAVRAHGENRQHPVGTCAMGTGADAVVDAALRVRGLDGLRVVDASVMPDEPGGNTNVPTIMIAEKAADLIRNRTLPPAAV